MQERHTNRKQYFEEQIYTTQKYVIPFIGEDFIKHTPLEILEIGSGEGGNMEPFLSLGHKLTGVELEEKKHLWAIDFFANHPQKENLTLICDNIYNFSFDKKYDLIIIRDVLEHIHNQEIFMQFLKNLLSERGKIFFAFPPWHNPFGGHQQICNSKLLSRLPFFHVLPRAAYKGILKIGKESKGTIDSLLEIKDTGITIERFKKYIKSCNYKLEKEEYYFINPNYEIKFELKPRRAWKTLSAIPCLRNFIVTSYYCVLSK